MTLKNLWWRSAKKIEMKSYPVCFKKVDFWRDLRKEITGLYFQLHIPYGFSEMKLMLKKLRVVHHLISHVKIIVPPDCDSNIISTSVVSIIS